MPGQTATDPSAVRPPVLFDGTSSEPTTLDEVIGQALGAASMCWDAPERAGVFHSDRAKVILDEVVDWIRANAEAIT